MSLWALAMMAVVAFGGARDTFYGYGHHKTNSVLYMMLAENLSVEDRFRLFTYKVVDPYGETGYALYSRFPLGGVVLIKLASMPFDGFASKILAARALMLALFAASALLACLAASRIAASRWIGVAAALIAFSSIYVLYHSDDIATEVGIDLFGCMLVFHGMVLFVQEGRFRQLAVKACAALLLGWHVYALLFAFIAFGIAGEIAARRRPSAPRDARHETKRIAFPPAVWALARSRYVALGLISLIFGVAVLGFNLVNEYTAYGGETRFSELSTFGSLMNRTGLASLDENDPNADLLEWRGFLSRQISRIGGAALPYALSAWERWIPEARDISPFRVAVGALALGATAASLAFARRDRALWASLALFGLLWAVVMRRQTFWPPHYFESVFYAGVPLALFSLALIRAREAWGERPIKALAVAALIAFAISAFAVSGLHDDHGAERIRKTLMSDFETIREKTAGKTAFIEQSLLRTLGPEFHQELDYYLAGSAIVKGSRMSFAQMRQADFVIGERADMKDGFVPLTPRNRLAFLYAVAPADLYHAEWRRALASKRVVNSVFDAHLDGDTLYYLKEPCVESDVRGRFLLSVHPADVDDLPYESRELGHESLNLSFGPVTGTLFEGKCIIRRELPNYEIARIETGQWSPDEGGLWSAVIDPTRNAADLEALWDANEKAFQAVADGEPAIRSGFDIYMEGGALTYLKEGCEGTDKFARFTLSVFPVNPEDLPEKFRALGHESLNFDFRPKGMTFGDKCMIRRELPNYEIARIETGQYIPGEGALWRAFIDPSADMSDLEALWDAAIADGDPAIRSDFDIYMEGGALTYLKEGCAGTDTFARFTLSVFPVNPEDLPEKFRALGHESLNFDFRPKGMTFGDKCMIRRELPNYEIARIETGQYIPGEGELWRAEAVIGDFAP